MREYVSEYVQESTENLLAWLRKHPQKCSDVFAFGKILGSGSGWEFFSTPSYIKSWSEWKSHYRV